MEGERDDRRDGEYAEYDEQASPQFVQMFGECRLLAVAKAAAGGSCRC
jgi:hypothetical protein